MNKRTKISFETINKGNYTVIPSKDIAEINRRIGEEMKPIVREFERKEYESWLAIKDKIKK